MDKPVLKELIQNDLTPDNISEELKLLLSNHKKQLQLLDDYEDLRIVLGNAGSSFNAASVIVNDLKKKK